MGAYRDSVTIRDAEQLDNLMRERKVTNATLAEYAGCSTAAVGHLRSGKRNKARPDIASKIALALEVDPDELFIGTMPHMAGDPVTPIPKQRGPIAKTPLARFLYEKLPPAMSVRALGDRARKLGHDVSDPTIQGVFSGRTASPSADTIRAIADALGIDPAEIAAAAEVQLGEGTPYTPPREASQLTARQRRAVDQMILAMVKG